MLPSFVIIGAQKAATTTLWTLLGRHPSVFMSQPKETDFFVAELAWRRGRAWYEGLFDGASGATAVGEASPSYAMHPTFAGVPARMATLVPSARLIYLIRHPVARMHSSYLHALALGQETRPLRAALLERSHYADTSRYASQIDQYLAHFEREQLLIVQSEHLATRPGEMLDLVLAHLGLEPGWRPPDLGARYHTTERKRVPRPWWRRLGGLAIRARIPPIELPLRIATSNLTTRPLTPAETAMPADLRCRLEDLVRPDVARLRGLLGSSFDAWGLLD